MPIHVLGKYTSFVILILADQLKTAKSTVMSFLEMELVAVNEMSCQKTLLMYEDQEFSVKKSCFDILCLNQSVLE